MTTDDSFATRLFGGPDCELGFKLTAVSRKSSDFVIIGVIVVIFLLFLSDEVLWFLARFQPTLCHVADKLVGHLGEYISRQLVEICCDFPTLWCDFLVVVEPDELDNIAACLLPVAIEKFVIVTIQSLHCREVSITDAYDDDAEWVGRTHDNLVDGLSEVVDHTVGQDKEAVVHLVLLHLAHVGLHGFEERRE